MLENYINDEAIIMKISGKAAKKGKKCTEWLSIKAFMKPNGAN